MPNDKTSNKNSKNTVTVSDSNTSEVQPKNVIIRNNTEMQLLMKEAMKKANSSSPTKTVKAALINFISNN